MKYIHFELTYCCNYHCEYCVQNHMKQNFDYQRLNASDEVVDGFINFIRNTNETCDITLLGGEIFVHKRVFDILDAILSRGFNLHIYSNFSFPLDVYKRMLEMNTTSKINFNLSLHLSQTSTDEFMRKLEQFVSMIKGDERYSYMVCSVLKEENFEVLKSFNQELKEKFRQELLFQNLLENGKEVSYSKEIEDFLASSNIKDANFEKKNMQAYENTFGTMCYSGCKWVLITPNGEIRRCLNPDQKGLSVLGNVKSGNINFLKGAKPCLSNRCICSISLCLNLIQFGKKNWGENIYYIIKYIWLFNLMRKRNVSLRKYKETAKRAYKKTRKKIINAKRKILGQGSR